MSRYLQNDLRYIKKGTLIRKIFYLHYSTLDELLGILQAELYTELLESISDFSIPDNLKICMGNVSLF